MNLVRVLEEKALKCPKRVAILFGKKKITYGELNRRVNCFYHGLAGSFKLARGERVAILLSNSPQYIISLFAVLKAGAIAVPLNTFLKHDELKYILSDCGVRILISSASFLEVIKGLRQAVPSLKEIVLTDKKVNPVPCRGGVNDYTYAHDIIERKKRENPGIDIDMHALALFMYTSGTTGYPKGAMLTHNNLLSNARASIEAAEITGRERILLLLPMFHSFTILVCILIPLCLGARIIIIKSLKPFRDVVKALFWRRVTMLVGIPHLFRVFKDIEVPRILLKLLAIRLCVSGAAPLAEDTLRSFGERFNIPLLEGYGLTEASPVVSLNPLEKQKPGSVGVPIPGVEVKVVRDDESELPRGEVGELIVKGPNVMKGYYNLPEETKEAIREGWLFTGDMAKIDGEGYIYIVDRKKDMILAHGLNIYPREIEEVLFTHPAIKEASVVGRIDPRRGEVPVAVVVKEEGRDLTGLEVIDFCKQKLANYKVPHIVEFREFLPKTPTGKVLKRELR